ncbi:hypothetical protein Vadar_002424 [Vaccinium darrowii]|uniref:Uncharacterized protein n=1 Tax=Vaccinium darrowii TaxID=229202 RepID=A0ACB7X7I2_9ERIC|nr:hypothetical protein Vadar_002424 [Vaccinium darrowii]
MVNLKISGRFKGLKLMQYLREGLVLQLFDIVVLKSGGGGKLLRTSMTEAAGRVRRGEERERRVKMRREIAEMKEEAMDREGSL